MRGPGRPASRSSPAQRGARRGRRPASGRPRRGDRSGQRMIEEGELRLHAPPLAIERGLGVARRGIRRVGRSCVGRSMDSVPRGPRPVRNDRRPKFIAIFPRREPPGRARGTSAYDPGRQPTFPLNVVLQACPDVMPYARSGIKTWRDMVSTAELIRSLLGVSLSAWADARTVFGEKDAATILVGILQRAAHISLPGGYLRDLTERGRRGGFSPGPMIMALLREQMHRQQRASS